MSPPEWAAICQALGKPTAKARAAVASDVLVKELEPVYEGGRLVRVAINRNDHLASSFEPTYPGMLPAGLSGWSTYESIVGRETIGRGPPEVHVVGLDHRRRTAVVDVGDNCVRPSGRACRTAAGAERTT